MTHADDLFPWDVGMSVSEFRGDAASSFSDQLKLPRNRSLMEVARSESLEVKFLHEFLRSRCRE